MDYACRGTVMASVKMLPRAGELTGLPVGTRRIRHHKGRCAGPARPVADAHAQQTHRNRWDVA